MFALETVRVRGFTLIELLVTIAIIGILAAFAIPSYTQYVLRAGRLDALSALSKVSVAQERYRLDHNGYATGLDQLGLSGMTVYGSGSSAWAATEGGRYSIHLEPAATAVSFTVEARTYGTQQRDVQCNYFRLTHTGVRSMGVGNTTTCWK